MKREFKNEDLYNNKGSVLVELALILPIILVISLTVFEFTRAIHHLTIASSASKEFANIIKRDCPEDPLLLGACLENQRLSFQQYLQSIVSGTELSITYLVPDSPRTAPNRNDATWKTLFSAGDLTKSRLSQLMNGNQLKTDYSKLDRHQSIVFSECYVPYSPILIFINSIFNLPFVSGDFLYDATII